RPLRNFFISFGVGSTVGGFACWMSVPEILTPLIPEILARLRTSRKDRKLPMLRLWRERREEDVGDAETTRSRDFAEGRSCEDRGSALERGIVALGKTHWGRETGGACRGCQRACQTTDWPAQHG